MLCFSKDKEKCCICHGQNQGENCPISFLRDLLVQLLRLDRHSHWQTIKPHLHDLCHHQSFNLTRFHQQQQSILLLMISLWSIMIFLKTIFDWSPLINWAQYRSRLNPFCKFWQFIQFWQFIHQIQLLFLLYLFAPFINFHPFIPLFTLVGFNRAT